VCPVHAIGKVAAGFCDGGARFLRESDYQIYAASLCCKGQEAGWRMHKRLNGASSWKAGAPNRLPSGMPRGEVAVTVVDDVRHINARAKALLPSKPAACLSSCTAAACLLFFCSLGFAQPQQENRAAFSQFRPRKEIPGVAFVGSDACADCHGLRTGLYAHTSMSHALFLPEDCPVLQSHERMTFRAAQYAYEIVRSGQKSSYRVTDGTETIDVPILYAFGNAHIAQTYVFSRDEKLYEARVSYYPAIDGLDWTVGDALNPPPSLVEAAGRDITSDEARNCFSCHSTAATANNKLQLDHFVPGVTCEACHGPGAKHVAAVSSGTLQDLYIFNPRTLDPETLSQEFCGACHRGVDTVAMMPNLNGLSNVRFQPYRLYNSRGHDPKDARFTCTACHDPHVELKQADPIYSAKCVTCHVPRQAAAAQGEKASGATSKQPAKSAMAKLPATSAAGKPCPVAKDNCVSCHMPKVELPGAHFNFTDHRIRIARPGEAYPY
jgi:cytochrome c554/c'-like protein